MCVNTSHTLTPTTTPTDQELWKPVQGYEGVYEISNHGRLKSLSRQLKNRFGLYQSKERIIKAHVGVQGYVQYVLRVQYTGKSTTAHRLVALHFIPNPLNLPQVNHIDSDKINNHHTNLEWVTNAQNVQHCYDNVPSARKYGENAKHFKGCISVFNRDGVLVDRLCGVKDMADKGYDFRNVFACIYGTRKTHRGMTFKRDEP